MQDDQPLKPANILNIVATNQGLRPLTAQIPQAKPLTTQKLKDLKAAGHAIVDTRSTAEFGAGHIAGAYNVQLSSSEFEQRVGWVVPDDTPIILVTGSSDDAQRAIYKMAFIALDTAVTGYLDGGMGTWIEAGEPLITIPQIDVHTLKHNLSKHGWHVLDTRDQDEWNEGHIAHAHFMPYTAMAPQLSMPSQLDKLTLKPKQKIAVVCASGKRSSTAVSMLLQNGYQRLYNVTGGMEAWQKAGLPMVDADGVACNI